MHTLPESASHDPLSDNPSQKLSFAGLLSKTTQLATLVLAACSSEDPKPEVLKPSVEQVAADICADGIQGKISPVKGAPKNTGFGGVVDERNDSMHGDFYDPKLECKPAAGIVPHVMAGHLLDTQAYLATDQGEKWVATYTFTPDGQSLDQIESEARWLDIPDGLIAETLHSAFLVVGKEKNKLVFTDGVEYQRDPAPYEEVLSENFPKKRQAGKGCVSVGFIKTLEGLQEKPYAPYLYIESQNVWAYGGTPITAAAFLEGMKNAKECESSAPAQSPTKTTTPKKGPTTTEGNQKITPRVSRAKANEENE